MAEIVTFGCRLNIHESEAIRQAAGEATADLIIVNSCAVTAEASRQARQAIRRLKRQRPEARLVVTGCGAHVDTARYAAMEEVSHVVGNSEKLDPQTWRSLHSAPRLAVGDIMAAPASAMPMLDGFQGRSRAFVQVQNGCDHRCTFCVIPFGRGPSRSVPASVVIEQVRRLVLAGYQEVVLTGVDLTSYGADLDGKPALGTLIRAILAAVPELPRLRLSSIDSIEADADLLRAIGEEERLMPHLHLSLQAGDDLILKRMKRRHAREDAIRFCAEVKRLRPDMAFGADLIAGFPTETEAMFQQSLEMIEQLQIVHLHAFPFSPRPGTPAAKMPQVARPVIEERARRLREAGTALLAARLQGEIGQTRSALMERGGLARSEQFFAIRPRMAAEPGSLVALTITGLADGVLQGESVQAGIAR